MTLPAEEANGFGYQEFGYSPFGYADGDAPVDEGDVITFADVGPTLPRLYARLPEHYRIADAAAGHPLYRWLMGIGSQIGDLERLIGRLDFYTVNDGGQPGDTSELVDPAVADVRWLEWLAQLVGVHLSAGMSDDERRDAIIYASSGWRAGTKQAIADAARAALSGTKYAQVHDHSVTRPGDGGVWDILIVTRGTETADPAAVLRTVNARGVKPAGCVLHHRTTDAAWATVESAFPNWNRIQAAGSWDVIQEAGL